MKNRFYCKCLTEFLEPIFCTARVFFILYYFDFQVRVWFFSNSANIVSWNQPRIQGIFLFWCQTVAKVCCVYLMLLQYQRSKILWRQDLIKHLKVYIKQILHKVWCFPLYLEFHVLIWTNPQIPVDLSQFKKKIKEKHPI